LRYVADENGVIHLFVNQCLTKYNKKCNHETLSYVENLIESQSEDALMRFVEKNGTKPDVREDWHYRTEIEDDGLIF
jgi:hypothetical protein